MARRPSHSSSSGRSRGKKQKKSSSTAIIITVVAIVAVALLGFGIWKLLHTDDYKFTRADLDKYVEASRNVNQLGDGAAVYVDMSDGMNSAYATPESKAMLQAVINKLAANSAIKFFGLADSKITPLDMSHTELYNYMLNPASYDKQKAPVEKTLQEITESNRPALLMTDFEEYKGSVIEKAAYAKKYFIDWLAKGYNITFYKWDFTESGKNKHMFLAVFDDNGNRLNSLVENAVKMTNPTIETYVLGARDFAYPTVTSYISLKQGGNYHDGNGKDAVTAVYENGGTEAYVSYAKPLANASGLPGEYASLDNLVGSMAEYYPLGVRWEDAIKNAKLMKEEGVKAENRYEHLLSRLFIDFGAQSGYSVDGVEVRVFDMQNTMKEVAEAAASAGGGVITMEAIEKIDKPEINMVLSGGMQSVNGLPDGWKEIYVDFDDKFDGKFMGGVPSDHLIRANVVISQATPLVERATQFFGWEGNPSLADSVKEALMASSSNPQGRILHTYYIKTISE